MKEFWIYTAMRVAMFLATFAIVYGVWVLVADDVPVALALVVAFLISGILSFTVLNRQRSAFAAKVERRVETRLERSRSKEDKD